MGRVISDNSSLGVFDDDISGRTPITGRGNALAIIFLDSLLYIMRATSCEIKTANVVQSPLQ